MEQCPIICMHKKPTIFFQTSIYLFKTNAKNVEDCINILADYNKEDFAS